MNCRVHGSRDPAGAARGDAVSPVRPAGQPAWRDMRVNNS